MPSIENTNDDILSETSYDDEYLTKTARVAQIKAKYDPLSRGLCYNPLTKKPYPFLVNSQAAKDAELYSVMHSTGQDKEPLKYYFDNKDQYMRFRSSKSRRR